MARSSALQSRPSFVMPPVVRHRLYLHPITKPVIEMSMKPQRRILIAALTTAAVVWSSALSVAADKGAIDPSGSWKLVTISSQTKAKSAERTLKLKLEGRKLTGTTDGRSEINGKVKMFEWPIKDTKLQGNSIAFTVTHAPTVGKGPDATTVYEGQISGDTMKGSADTEWNGHTNKLVFEARRVKE